MLKPGQIFAHFKILEKIGEGGMGAVYLAEDQNLHRKVAIKILLPEAFDNNEKQERFKREAKTAAQISHGNVMSIFDIGSAKDEKSGKDIDYIVMEHIQGRQLSELFHEGNVSLAKVVKIAEKICNGLAAAHKLNIVHRDIKADNIIVDDQDEPKILDFGLAKPIDPIFESSDANTDTVDNELTKAGKIIGTVTYMSPEQAKGEHVDMRSDIFSFGILLYRMTTGEFPFSGPTQVSTIAKILETKHEPPRLKNSNIPAELERIIDKCLQKNPEDRYQDTRDLVVDLRNLRRQFDSGFTDTISAEIERPSVTKTVEISFSKKSYGIVGLLVAVAAVIWFMMDTPSFKGTAEVQAQGYSLAIIGFDNKTGESEYDWLETGLPEILLTDLMQSQSVQIISQKRILDGIPPEKRSEHTFEEAVESAGKLGAVHILSGSYYKLGDKIRIDSRIEDVSSGNIISTQKVIGADPFELIDSLTEKIAIALNLQKELSSDKSVSKYTSSPEAYKYYIEGMNNFALGTDEIALEKFNKAIEIDSSFALPYLRIALTRLFNGRDKEGVEYLTMAKEREQNLPIREKTLLEVYSEIWIERNYNDGYVKMESFVNQFPDDKEGQSIFGLLINSFSQDTTKAFEHFDKALQIDPAFQLTLMFYAQIYINNKNYDRALEFAERSIKYHPNSPDGYTTVATIKSLQGKTDEAISAYLDVLEKYPESEDVLSNLYDIYIKKRDFNKARQYLEMIKRYHSDDLVLMSKYYLYMSNLAIWEGKFEQSLKFRIDALDERLKTEDSTLISATYNSLGSYCRQFEKYDEAKKYYNLGNDWYNSFQNFSYYMAMVFLDSTSAKTRRVEFVKVLDDFKARVPSNLWYIADDLIGMYDAWSVHDTTTGLKYLRDLGQKNSNSNNNTEIGKLEIMTGEYQAGIDKLEQYVNGEDESSNAFNFITLQFYIGYGYEKLGQIEKAKEHYESLLQYWSNADIQIQVIKDTKERYAQLTS